MKKNLLIILILILAFALRVPFLDKHPAGLNADEAAIGYNVYSLLTTGRDEHGASWPLVFRSFDDYKPAGYFYLVLPFVAALGVNVWAVRLPSALMGILAVYFIYLLVNKLFPKKHLELGFWKLEIGDVAALILAISPWHIHFSRGGWEANVASVLMLIGLYFLVKSLLDTRYFLLTTIFFILSLYTYHSLRVILPLVFISFIIIYFKEIRTVLAKTNQLKPVAVSVVLGILFLVPLFLQFTSVEGRSRFSGVSVFADQGPLWQALELRREAGNTLAAKFLYNRYASYSYRFTENYLSHFSARFLFFTGDVIARSKVPGMGQAYLWTAPFLAYGLYLLLKQDSKSGKIILSWFFIAPLAAALTFQSPHALRAQNMVYPLTIITAIGLYESLSFISSLRWQFILPTSYLLLATLLGYDLSRYLHEYYIHYPKELPYAWQYGFDQIADYSAKHADQYDHIIISDRYDQPYILIAFYQKTPPSLLQQIPLTPRDQFGFSTIREMGKYQFHRVDWGVDSRSPNTLIIAADEGAPDELTVARIYDPASNTMYRIFDTNKLK